MTAHPDDRRIHAQATALLQGWRHCMAEVEHEAAVAAVGGLLMVLALDCDGQSNAEALIDAIASGAIDAIRADWHLVVAAKAGGAN